MTEALILHHYDASPFTQKTLRMLGIKGLDWDSVETPMIPPKDDLTILTGGYRGTPVLQIGADIYIDNQRIATELERRYPQPSLFPYGNHGLNQALVSWSHDFFRSGLHMVIARQSKDWPEEFSKDRQYLFNDIDFNAAEDNLEHAASQLRAYASLINTQLKDGRAFLEGDKPSLADIHAFSIPWFTRAAMPEINELLKAFTHLPGWEERVHDIGEGTRNVIEAKTAHEVALRSSSNTESKIDPDDVQGLTFGQSVIVAPDDSQRGAVEGELVVSTANEIAVKHVNEAVGEMVVHFPRIGYRVTVAS